MMRAHIATRTRLTLALLFICIAPGCISTLVDIKKDVTASPDRWGGYRPGEVYALTADVSLDRDDVAVQKSDDPGTQFVLSRGTRLCIDKFIEHTGPNTGVYVFATILDGPYRGKQINMSDLSLRADHEETPPAGGKPDLTKVRRVEP